MEFTKNNDSIEPQFKAPEVDEEARYPSALQGILENLETVYNVSPEVCSEEGLDFFLHHGGSLKEISSMAEIDESD